MRLKCGFPTAPVVVSAKNMRFSRSENGKMRRGKYEAKAEEEEEEQEEGRKGKEAGYEEGKERMGEYKELYWMALKEVIRKKTKDRIWLAITLEWTSPHEC